jgi:hypothetical protein
MLLAKKLFSKIGGAEEGAINILLCLRLPLETLSSPSFPISARERRFAAKPPLRRLRYFYLPGWAKGPEAFMPPGRAASAKNSRNKREKISSNITIIIITVS